MQVDVSRNLRRENTRHPITAVNLCAQISPPSKVWFAILCLVASLVPTCNTTPFPTLSVHSMITQ